MLVACNQVITKNLAELLKKPFVCHIFNFSDTVSILKVQCACAQYETRQRNHATLKVLICYEGVFYGGSFPLFFTNSKPSKDSVDFNWSLFLEIPRILKTCKNPSITYGEIPFIRRQIFCRMFPSNLSFF